MTKVVVVYDSDKRKCKYVAEKVARNYSFDIYDVRENPKIQDKQVIILVIQMFYAGENTKEMCLFAKRLPKNIKVIVISNVFKRVRNWNGGIPLYKWVYYNEEDRVRTILKEKEIELIDSFYCYRSLVSLGGINKNELERLYANIDKQLKFIKEKNA